MARAGAGVTSRQWVERRACHGCIEIDHILRDCPKAAGAGKGRATSLALEDGSAAAPRGPVSRGAFASFALKRRPVGCASDSVWRSVGSCGMATAGCEANRIDYMFNTDPDIHASIALLLCWIVF